MKKFKKILALALAVVMVFAMSVTTFADGEDEGGETPAVTTTTGSITVKNATKGHTYTAYKVFDATYNGTAVSYKTPAANASKLNDTLFGWSTAADSDGNISVWKLSTASESDVTDWIEDHYADFGGTAIPGAFDATNSTVTFSNLDFGYYYITSSLGSVVTIDSAVPTVTVYDKNETTPVDPVKKIVSVDGVAQNEVTEANAHVGSVVGFKVTAKTNNWIDKDTIRTEWTTTDTATNMIVDPETIVVKVNGEEISNFTASGDGAGGFTLTIPMVDDNGNSVFAAPADGLIPIEITYSATITAAAAKAPAKNEIPGSPVKVYTYGFQVAKTDGTDPLPGAQFELWYNGAALKFIDNGDGTYTYSADGTVTTLDMTTNTTICVLGLDTSWEYTLKEITVPEGYNQVEDITVSGGDLTQISETTVEADGTTTTTAIDTSITSTALYKETVVNNKGVELPSTGGMGTTILYIVGGVVVAAALVLLITKRRMRREDY